MNEKEREQARLRKQRQRDKERVKSVTLSSVTSPSVTDPRIRHLAKALIDPIKRSKLLLLSNALKKTITGLDGKPLRLGRVVRYGISGFTFDEIKELL